MKKALLIFVLAMAVVGGGVFADDSDFASMPKNTITVDIGPTIIGFVGKTFLDMVSSGSGADVNSFGIGAQYERQLGEELSVGGRFAYMTFGVGFSDDDAAFSVALSSFSIEGHVRYYPGGNVFFLDGMLGYANLAVGFSGKGTVEKENGEKTKETFDFSVPRDYLKLGIKIGWRVDAGNPGGFIFEPSFGWSLGVGLGKPIEQKLSDKLGGDVSGTAFLFWYAEQFIFIGGPRLSLAFGWSF